MRNLNQPRVRIKRAFHVLHPVMGDHIAERAIARDVYFLVMGVLWRSVNNVTFGEVRNPVIGEARRRMDS